MDSVEVTVPSVCDISDPFTRIGVKLADPEFRKMIATKDPQNKLYMDALRAVNRLGFLGEYDCIHDKPLERKLMESNEPK